MEEFQKKYVEAMFGWDKAPKEGSINKLEQEKLELALERAYKTRDFEIELYWKRATYFWAFQAIAFTVAGFLMKEEELPKQLWLMLIPAGLGAITAYAGYLTAKGSKFWQESWEAHVGMLEEMLGIRSTMVILSNGPRSYSVSKVNRRLMCLFTALWLVMFIAISVFYSIAFLQNASYFNMQLGHFIEMLNIIGILLISIILIVSLFLLFYGTRSDLPGWEYSAKDEGNDENRKLKKEWVHSENNNIELGKNKEKKSKNSKSKTWRIIWSDTAGGKRSDPNDPKGNNSR